MIPKPANQVQRIYRSRVKLSSLRTNGCLPRRAPSKRTCPRDRPKTKGRFSLSSHRRDGVAVASPLKHKQEHRIFRPPNAVAPLFSSLPTPNSEEADELVGITKTIVTDLLPGYLVNEISSDSRHLVEFWFAQNPAFAALSPGPSVETAALLPTRSLLRTARIGHRVLAGSVHLLV